MSVRFYIDPDTDRHHVEQHGVTALEFMEALERATKDYAGYGRARMHSAPLDPGES